VSQLEIVFDNDHNNVSLTQLSPSNEERLVVISVIKQGERFEIVRQKHDISDIKNWLCAATNGPDTVLPKFLNDDHDILLRKIDMFYEKSSDEELEKYAEEMFEFRMKHDLRFAFRGTDVTSAVIYRRNGKIRIEWQRENGFFVEDIDDCPLTGDQSVQKAVS
jgi:hypothetical protein